MKEFTAPYVRWRTTLVRTPAGYTAYQTIEGARSAAVVLARQKSWRTNTRPPPKKPRTEAGSVTYCMQFGLPFSLAAC
jgi:hypothetical protein